MKNYTKRLLSRSAMFAASNTMAANKPTEASSTKF